jgi:hypothetical protein
VVDEGSDLLANRLINDTANDKIGKFGVGTGTVAPMATDTRSTFTNLFIKDIDSANYELATQKLTFQFILELNEYNGNTIGEVGLFSDGPTNSERLFARRIITSIDKEDNIKLNGIWIIQF